MTSPQAPSAAPSGTAIDRLASIAADSPLQQLRALRPEVLRAAEESDTALFNPADLGGVSEAERELIALRVAVIEKAPAVAARHRANLERIDPSGTLAAAAVGFPEAPGLPDRAAQLLRFTDRLTLEPRHATRDDIASLEAAGLAPRDVITVAQLISYLSFQVRLIAALGALKQEAEAPRAAPAVRQPVAVQDDSPALSAPLGFTMDAVDWAPWLPPVEQASASEEQDAVVRKTTPAGWGSAYFALLAHDVEALRARTDLFQSTMYAPRGLPRSDRELASVAVSRVNGCVYCASVHGRLYGQITKRPEVIQRIFDEGVGAELEPRERAIVDYAVALTLAPAELGAADIVQLRAAGLGDQEILDATHVIAMFAWANRLLETLGEVVYQPQPA
jgi:uncharacterized peroxidase-related enzyme